MEKRGPHTIATKQNQTLESGLHCGQDDMYLEFKSKILQNMDMLVKDMIKHKPLVYNEAEATQDVSEKKATNNRQMTIQLQQTSRVCFINFVTVLYISET